jgi:hypothetical protein
VPTGLTTDRIFPFTDIASSYQGWWGGYVCNDGIRNDEYPESAMPIVPGFDDHRLIVITSLVQWTPGESGFQRVSHRISWIQKFTAIMCKPKYSIDTYPVTFSQQQPDNKEPFAAIKQAGTSERIDGFTEDALVPLLKEIADQSGLNDEGRRGDDPLFIVMLHMCGDSDTVALMNQTTLLEVAPKAFSGVMAQAFHDYFTTPSLQKIAAKFAYWETGSY